MACLPAAQLLALKLLYPDNAACAMCPLPGFLTLHNNQDCNKQKKWQRENVHAPAMCNLGRGGGRSNCDGGRSGGLGIGHISGVQKCAIQAFFTGLRPFLVAGGVLKLEYGPQAACKTRLLVVWKLWLNLPLNLVSLCLGSSPSK
eukprot:1136920-Pelagomonas_calceolata.AAC.4